VGLAFGFEVNIYPRLFLVFSLFLKINTGDVVKFDNAGGTVEEISLRKTTLRPRRNRAPHSTWRNKESIEFLRISPV
jgi:small-conductance mechanosensitive channel